MHKVTGISKLTSLELLEISSTSLGPNEIISIAQLTNLKELRLGTLIRNLLLSETTSRIEGGIPFLTNLKSLYAIKLTNLKHEPIVTSLLKQQTNLIGLYLPGVEFVSDEFLQQLRDHVQLMQIDFSRCDRLTDTGIANFIQFHPRLRKLLLSNLAVGVETVSAICSLKFVQVVNISNCLHPTLTTNLKEMLHKKLINQG